MGTLPPNSRIAILLKTPLFKDRANEAIKKVTAMIAEKDYDCAMDLCDDFLQQLDYQQQLEYLNFNELQKFKGQFISLRLNAKNTVLHELKHELNELKHEIDDSLTNKKLATSYKCETTNKVIYIDAHIYLAEQVSKSELPKITKQELILFAYRKAADAGSGFAQLELVKMLLFCSNEMPFMPFEAEEWLLKLANGNQVTSLQLTSPVEHIIGKLIKLINANKQKADDTEKLRKTLANELWHSKSPSIKAITPMLYLSSLFGEDSTKKAQSCIKQINPLLNPSLPLDINHIWQYWQLKIQIHSNGIDSCDQQLTLLCSNNFLAAMYLKLEHMRWEKEITFCTKVVEEFVQGNSPIQLAPHLCYSLYQCQSKHERYLKQSQPVVNAKRADITQKCNQYYVHAIRNGHEPALFQALNTKLAMESPRRTYKQVGLTSSVDIPIEFINLLHSHRFSQSTTVLIYTHLKQYLSGEMPDEDLIKKAMQQDTLKSSLSLLFLEYSTETQSLARLSETVLHTPNLSAIDFRMYIELDCGLLFQALSLQDNIFFTPDPKSLFRLLTELRKANDKHRQNPESITCQGIHESDSKSYLLFLELQGNTQAADSFDNEMKTLNLQGEFPEINKHHRFHQGLPKECIDLGRVRSHCFVGAEFMHSYTTFMDLFSYSKFNPNPKFDRILTNKCFNFIRYSKGQLTTEQLFNLIGEYLTCLNRCIRIEKAAIKQAALRITTRVTPFISSTKSVNLYGLEQLTQENLPSTVVVPELEKTVYRLHHPKSSSGIFIVHRLEQRRFLEELKAVSANQLLQEIETSETCPIALIDFFPRDLTTLNSTERDTSLKGLKIISRKLRARFKLICDNDRSETELKIRLIQYHAEPDSKEIEPNKLQWIYEKMMFSLTINRTEELKKFSDDTFGYTNEGSLQQSCRLSEQSYAEQLVKLLDDSTQLSEVVAWIEFNKEHLQNHNEIDKLISLSKKGEIDSHFKDFIICYINSTAEAKRFLNTQNPKSSGYRISEVRYVEVILFSLTASLISPDQAKDYLNNLTKDDLYFSFLNCYLGLDLESNYTKFILHLENLSIHEKDGLCTPLGHKFFNLHQLKKARTCWESGKKPFLGTLVQWKHLKAPHSEINIKALKSAAAAGNNVAQCRLLDWYQYEIDEISSSLYRRCCRYILTPHFHCTPEKELYQGLLRAGVFKKIDIEQIVNTKLAQQHISNALKHESPIPSIRLMIIKYHSPDTYDSIVKAKLIDINLTELLTSKILIALDKTFTEILISCSKEELNYVLEQLKKNENAEQPEIKKARLELEKKVTHWNALSQESPLPPASEETIDTSFHTARSLLESIKSNMSPCINPRLLITHVKRLNHIEGNLSSIPEELVSTLFSVLLTTSCEKKLLDALYKLKTQDSEKATLIEHALRQLFSVNVDHKLVSDPTFIEKRDYLVQKLPETWTHHHASVTSYTKLLKSYQLKQQVLPNKILSLLSETHIDFLSEVLEPLIKQSTKHLKKLCKLYIDLISDSEINHQLKIKHIKVLEIIFKKIPTTIDDRCKVLELYLIHSLRLPQYIFINLLTPAGRWEFFGRLKTEQRIALLLNKTYGKDMMKELSEAELKQFKKGNLISENAKNHLLLTAKLDLNSGQNLNLRSLLKFYLNLKDFDTDNNILDTITQKLRTTANHLHAIPVQEWDGNKDRLLAHAVIKMLDET